MTSRTQLLRINSPIMQAPVAGTATPAIAAAVSNAGGPGGIGIASSDSGYAAQSAGQGAFLSRAMPAAELVTTLRAELAEAAARLAAFA